MATHFFWSSAKDFEKTRDWALGATVMVSRTDFQVPFQTKSIAKKEKKLRRGPALPLDLAGLWSPSARGLISVYFNGGGLVLALITLPH